MWPNRSGARSVRARTSTSFDWRVADVRPAFFCAYMRWSAIRSASVASCASRGSTIAPYEEVTLKPSPCSVSADAAPAMIGSATSSPGSNSAQNSSPPIRNARPRPLR